MKKVYVVRHCKAEGQEQDAPLTELGLKQAEVLTEFFANQSIDRIISSPFQRAVQTVKPLSKKIDVQIETDHRLVERVLSTKHLPDWLEKLERTFSDLDLAFEGGESSNEATERVVEVIEEIFAHEEEGTVMVTHGGLMSLLLNHFTGNFGFDDWKDLRNPDIYILSRTDSEIFVERMDLETEIAGGEDPRLTEER